LALLRGINVGGKNKLPMKSLVEIFERLGCADVRTYIQSGNAIFTAAGGVTTRLVDLITIEISQQFGYKVPVVLRTTDQMRHIVANNPFLQAGADHEELHVMFLAHVPAPRRLADLDPGRSSPDSFEVRGQEVYLRLPNGVARSKLTNDYFDSKLATISTSRNWRTVTKLLALMS
jgi:uncharacterized protein (DUF1697 family)